MKDRLERPAPHRRDRPAGPHRAAGGAPLHAAQPEELRHRHGRLSAGLVHHEAQPAPQREGGAPARLRRPPSAAAGLDRAGRARADRPAGALAEDADRHAGRGDVAGRRRAWRAVRHDGDPRRPRGQGRARQRKVVLVPESAHGTNPATAAALGYTVKPIPANERGRVDLAALKAELGPDVAAIMLTNPNTCGLFETEIVEIAEAVHEAGAYFYCDGANFNAIVGRVRPGDLGIDGMHINLHKTFSTPHGGGGPGAGPVVLSEALAPYAPVPWIVKDGDKLARRRGRRRGRRQAARPAQGASTARWACSSARSPTCMSHGADGLRQVAEDAVLNANYIMAALKDVMTPAFDGPCMHEALFDDSFLEGHRRHHARLRQGDDRRGLPPDDHVLPAGRAWRDADRADREPRPRKTSTASSTRCARSPSAPRPATRPRTSRPRPASPRAAASTRRSPPASRCCAGGRRTIRRKAIR